MVERPGVMPPVQGGPPPRRRPPARTLATRRALAVAGLLVGVGVAVWAGASALGGDSKTGVDTVLVAPAPKPLRVIFPEGFNRREMATRVDAVRAIAKQKRRITPRLTAKGYLAATAKAQPPAGFPRGQRLEGFLFPAAYEFTKTTTAEELVAEQLESFRANWAKVDLRAARKKNLTPYDVLIIASMIEKETIAPDERPLVAAVIYNRLKLGMSLGIDATIRYGLDVPGTESLRQSQLDSDNPYNTRLRPGLPPTPIANPGLASMQAAAHPVKKDYLFFVRKPDRVHHFFTASEAEFYAKACEYGYGCQ